MASHHSSSLPELRELREDGTSCKCFLRLLAFGNGPEASCSPEPLVALDDRHIALRTLIPRIFQQYFGVTVFSACT